MRITVTVGEPLDTACYEARLTKAALFLVFLLVAAFAAGLLVGRASAPEPPRAYLSVTTDRLEAETYGPFYVLVSSRIWSVNESGNTTLVWNDGYVNISIEDVTHNVSIGYHVLPLVYGNASDRWIVGEAWTSSTLNVTVRDELHGLEGHATIRTVYSDEFLVRAIGREYFGPAEREIAALRADFNGAVALITTIATLAVVAFAVMWAAYFLRIEHRKARRHHLSSIWDRFADRVWPYSMVDDDTYILLDPRRTWNKDLAHRWRKRVVEARCRDLDQEVAEIEREKDLVRKGLTDL